MKTYFLTFFQTSNFSFQANELINQIYANAFNYVEIILAKMSNHPFSNTNKYSICCTIFFFFCF